MTCELPPDPQNRIYSFSANYTLNGPYSASFNLVDFSCNDESICGNINTPVCVRLSQTQPIQIVGPDSDQISQETRNCYDEDPCWVSGPQRSFEERDNHTTIGVTSFSEFLNEKPICTQLFQFESLSTVLDTVFRFYAGVPLDLLDINSFTDTSIVGPVSGTTFSELQQLAQAGRANLFVQVGGNLTIERWKDHTDPVEFVIDPTLTIEATKAQYRCLLYTSPSPRDATLSRMPSSA